MSDKYAAFGTSLSVGVKQIETATAAGTVTASGDATVIVTAAGVTGSAITFTVAVLENDTPTMWAAKVRTALLTDANLTAVYDVGGYGPYITLTRKIAAANDATLNIAIDNDTSAGITTAATSANTRAGVAPVDIAQVSNLSGPGLSMDTEDVTTHDSTGAWEEHVGTILRSGELTIDIVYDPNAATHAGLLTQLAARTAYNFAIEFPSTAAVTWRFDGFVTGFEPSAPVDGALTASVTVKITGQPTLA
jgi:predicted secreted protein